MTFFMAKHTANRQLTSRYVEGESVMFKKCWEHIQKPSMASVVAGDQGRSNMVVRGTEVRGLDGGGRMVFEHQNMLNRQISTRYFDCAWFHDQHESGTALNVA